MLSVSAKCNKLQMKSKLIFNKATQMFGPHSGLWNSAGDVLAAGECPFCLGQCVLVYFKKLLEAFQKVQTLQFATTFWVCRVKYL